MRSELDQDRAFYFNSFSVIVRILLCTVGIWVGLYDWSKTEGVTANLVSFFPFQLLLYLTVPLYGFFLLLCLRFLFRSIVGEPAIRFTDTALNLHTRFRKTEIKYQDISELKYKKGENYIIICTLGGRRFYIPLFLIKRRIELVERIGSVMDENSRGTTSV